VGDGPIADRASLGQAIRARRQALGLTQEELAARVGEGVQQSDISRLERDKISLPHAARLRALARALALSPGELLVCAGWAGADEPRSTPAAPTAPAPPPASPAPGSDRCAALDPTRLGQARLAAHHTMHATAHALARADLVWAWATDPTGSRRPFAAFAAQRPGSDVGSVAEEAATGPGSS
jgi:transcriptional regulator with XRE-family HTH domain